MKNHKLKLLLFCLVASFLMLIEPSTVEAIMVVSKSSNTTVILGYNGQLEYENPLSGGEIVGGYTLLEWRDADYSPGPPPWYDDFTVSAPGVIDGDYGQIWMRSAGHSIWTSTTIASTTVSIHMCGDDNDGLAEVLVDSSPVATLDMVTPPGLGEVLIIVTDLSNTTHTIKINDLGSGSGSGTDVATLGAAALGAQQPIPTVTKWGLIIMVLLLLTVGTVMIRRRVKPVLA